MSPMSSAGSSPAASTLSINNAGVPMQAARTRSVGVIKNPTLGESLRYHARLMSREERRAANLDRLDRNRDKLAGEVLCLIKTTANSLNPRATGPRDTPEKTRHKTGKLVKQVTCRMEKVLAFKDLTRTDGMPQAMRERYGDSESGVSIETLRDEATRRALNASGKTERKLVLDYMAGAAGETSDDVASRAISLASFSNSKSNISRPGRALQVVEGFKWAREDRAIRHTLTAQVMDFEKLASIGERIRAEITVSKGYSQTATNNALPSPVDMSRFPSTIDLPSMNRAIEDGTMRTPMPPTRAKPAMDTERSCARVVGRMSTSQRERLRARLNECGHEQRNFARNDDPEKGKDLLAAKTVLSRVLDQQEASAKEAFGRYGTNQQTVDFKSLSAPFAKYIPHIKHTWRAKLFGNATARKQGLQNAINKVVVGCRQAQGVYKGELTGDRHAYYQSLAKELAGKYQERLPYGKPHLSDYNVQNEIFKLLLDADQAQIAAERSRRRPSLPMTPLTASMASLTPPTRLGLGSSMSLDQSRFSKAAVVQSMRDSAADISSYLVSDSGKVQRRSASSDTEVRSYAYATSPVSHQGADFAGQDQDSPVSTTRGSWPAPEDSGRSGDGSIASPQSFASVSSARRLNVAVDDAGDNKAPANNAGEVEVEDYMVDGPDDWDGLPDTQWGNGQVTPLSNVKYSGKGDGYNSGNESGWYSDSAESHYSVPADAAPASRQESVANQQALPEAA